MALSINISTKIMRVAAGEPIVFAYQPNSTAGIAEPLTGRAFVFSIYDAARVSHGYFDATIIDGTGTDPVALWRLDGLVSEGLLGGSGLKWELAERLDNGRDIIITGSLTVDVSAPPIGDYDSAPIARYITRITRKNDPETIETPFFTVKITAFAPVSVPSFSVSPSIGGAAIVGSTLTANDGSASAPITSRQWFLNSTAINGATGSTFVVTVAGSYTFRATATNSAGSTSTTSAPTVVQVPAPAFTAQPSISPSSGTVGQVFTATDGTVSNGTITGRQWVFDGTPINGATNTSYTSVAVGSLAYRVTASGNGSVSATSAGVAVAKGPAPFLSISSAVSKPEGKSETTDYSWTLTLNRDGSTASYPFDWIVAGNGSSPANAADFGGSFPSGSGVFASGETSKTITVLVNGDLAVEPDETFALTVSATGLATVSSSGTIINDDSSVFSTGVWNDSANWSDGDVWADA